MSARGKQVRIYCGAYQYDCSSGLFQATSDCASALGVLDTNSAFQAQLRLDADCEENVTAEDLIQKVKRPYLNLEYHAHMLSKPPPGSF